MKKIIVLFLMLSIMFSTVYADKYYYDGKWSEHTENIKLYVDSTKIYCDVPPVIVNDRTLVPARAFFEKLGCKVSWDEKKRKVSVSNDKYDISLIIDSDIAYIGKDAVTLDVPAKIITDKAGTGRTMIPVRFVAEYLGFDVEWDGNSYAVKITAKKTFSKITKVTAKKYSNYDIITVCNNDLVEPKVIKLSDPSRLVFDFYGCEFSTGDKKLGGGTCYSELRYAQHEEYARIVLAMTCEYTYNISYTDSECVIKIKKTKDLPNEDKDTAEPSKPEPSKVPADKNGLVVIDPGHGGSDPGAIGYKDGEINITEADVNLDISLRLYNILKSKGVNVAITRTKDEWVDLYDRAPFANSLDASFFISVHNNSSVAESANGSSVYYYTGTTDEDMKEEYGITSKEAAQIILDGILESCGLYNRKIADGSKLVVLKNTKMPSVLVEGAFISNPEEQEMLASPEFRQKMAEGIASGVMKVLKKMGIK